MIKLAIIIPAYNEENSIENVVQELNNIQLSEGIEKQVIVINDCSTDKTAEIIKKLDCIDIHLPSNLGIGGAVQTGLMYAKRNGYNWAVQVDGDGQHPAKELPKLIQCMQETNADIVIGSRFLIKEGFQSSFMRRIGINYFKHLIKFLCNIIVTDSTSGFRLMNEKALSYANYYYPDDYPEPESIIYFKLKQLKIAETPINMSERQGGKSSINAINSIYYIVKVTLAVIYTHINFRYFNKKLI